jgi:hypothetical protein
MKIDPAVRKQTGRVAAGTAVLTVLMIAVFLILRKFDYTVLLGAMLGFLTAVGNFFLMALTVQRLTDGMPALPKEEEAPADEEADADEKEKEEKKKPLSTEARQAGRKMEISFVLRLLMIGLVALIALKVPVFNPWAALIPLLFPNLVIMALKNSIGKGA